MVDVQFGEKNYMVENKIIQIIHGNLKEYVKKDDIKVFLDYAYVKYLFNISDYRFEIVYVFMDNFYRIKLEKRHYGQLQNITFLTKSKKFQKDIKLNLRSLKLSRKVFENHIIALTVYLSKLLEQHKNLNCLVEAYISDLKFDGIFL